MAVQAAVPVGKWIAQQGFRAAFGGSRRSPPQRKQYDDDDDGEDISS